MKKYFWDDKGKPSIKRMLIAFFTTLYGIYFFSNLYFSKCLDENLQASMLDIMKYLIVAIFLEPVSNKLGINLGGNKNMPVPPPPPPPGEPPA